MSDDDKKWMSIDISTAPESFKRCLPYSESAIRSIAVDKAQAQATMAFCEASHKELLDQIKAWCAINDVICISARMDRKSTLGNGVWDCHFLRNGYGCALELKIPPDKLSDDQTKYQETLHRCGVPGAVVHDLPSAIQFVKASLHLT
jgi:hypothetical protein